MDAEMLLAGAILVLVAALAYQLRNLYGLSRWLDRGDTADPPRAYGKWDRLHALIQRRLRDGSRRQAELATALRRWEEAARALPDGVVILADGHIAWCNGTAQLHLEIDPVRDIGRPLTHLVRIPEFLAYLEGSDFSKPLQVRAPHDERLLSLRVIPYGDRSLVLSRDVTQFEALERTRREFVANVSHELRTPLTVVAGFLETLENETDPAAARRYVDLMSEQSRRMLRLVEDLLTLSALESSPPPPMEDAVPMRPLVERLGAEARALSAGRHRIEVEAEEGLDLVGSEKELASAFGNLVSNAIRYTPEKGLVRLCWKRSEDGAEFSVEDTGIGIPAEHIARLTERFYRVDRGRSRETGGTGLGLAIVKHALSRHGAQLHVKSQPGAGSTFSARFGGPRLKASRAAA